MAAADQPSGIALWAAGARPRTLPAAVVPVLVGTAAAAGVDGGSLKGLTPWRFLAAAVVALAIQVGTNYANDYSDGVRGTDSAARVGPMRLVGSGAAAPGDVKRAALLSFGVAAIAGLLLAAAVSWWLLLVGAVSFAAGWLYTGGPKPYGYYGFGELFVFVFFGIVATVGSAYVQVEELTGLALLASLPVGMLATALLVVNNLRDIPSDTEANKRTLAVRMGDQWTRALYVALVVSAIVWVVPIALVGDRPWALVAVLAGALAVTPVRAVLHEATGPALVAVLSDTGRVQLAFGLLFALGLLVSA